MHSLLVQDFHQFLPHLLSNIFGFDQTAGWGLRYLTTSHPDFEIVYAFLNPGGDLFNLLAKLDDKEFSYGFPLGCMPVSWYYLTQLPDFFSLSSVLLKKILMTSTNTQILFFCVSLIHVEE